MLVVKHQPQHSHMHIEYLSNIRMPSERANAVQTIQMCNAFEKQGHTVNLITSNRKTHIIQSPEEYYGTSLSFSLIKVWTPPIFPWGAIFFMFTNIAFVCMSYFVLKKKPYDLVYCRDEWICYLLSFFVFTNKLVFESHEAKYNFPARRIIAKGVRCICISEGIHDFYLKENVSLTQLCVAHDGIDDSFFEPHILKKEAQEKLSLHPEKKIVMYIGGFDAWKGVDIFFETAERMKEYLFVAIGGTDLAIEEYSKQYPKVLFLGSKPYSELVHNQQAADILVIPNTAKNTLSSQYTSPLKLFAHMSSKVPMVLSDIPSLKAVLPVEAGNWFVPDSSESLQETITQTAAAVEQNQSKAHQAYELSKSYSWDNRAQTILNFLRTDNTLS